MQRAPRWERDGGGVGARTGAAAKTGCTFPPEGKEIQKVPVIRLTTVETSSLFD